MSASDRGPNSLDDDHLTPCAVSHRLKPTRLTDQSTKGGNLAHLLGIVGSGAIARGLARAAAEHHEVVVWARSEQSAEKAAEKGGAARVVTDLDALAVCNIIAEGVAEDSEPKCRTHKTPGELLPAETILATTT